MLLEFALEALCTLGTSRISDSEIQRMLVDSPMERSESFPGDLFGAQTVLRFGGIAFGNSHLNLRGLSCDNLLGARMLLDDRLRRLQNQKQHKQTATGLEEHKSKTAADSESKLISMI